MIYIVWNVGLSILLRKDKVGEKMNSSAKIINFNNEKIRSISILKGIGMIMVLLVHSRQMFEGINKIFHLFSFGQMGTQLFFVISGFVLSMTWMKNKLNNSAVIKSFYFKRYISIAPGYCLGILFYFVLNACLFYLFQLQIPVNFKNDVLSILVNMFLLNGLFPFCNNNVVPGGWYIGTLILIYLLFPLCINTFERLYRKNKKYIKIGTFLFLLASLLIQINLVFVTKTTSFSNNGFLYFSILNQLPCFLIGMVLYFDYINDELKRFNAFISYFGFVSVFTLTALLFFTKISILFMIIPFICSVSYYWLFVVCTYHIDWNKNKAIVKLSSLLENYGKHSYAIYLSHWIFVWYLPVGLLNIIKNIGLNISSTILYIVLIIPMIVLSYHFALLFEKMIQRMKNIFELLIGKFKVATDPRTKIHGGS